MSTETFAAKAPQIMTALMADFPIGLDDAAAILGNLGHESGGLATLQEITPTVKGSAGGYGWPQWTGPRRRAYESYCARNRLDPASDRANYAYLFLELKGSEKGAIAKLVAADGLRAKVEAFEQGFERAGVKHYDSRMTWAQRALDAWHAASAEARAPTFLPAPITVPETPVPTPRPEPEKPAPIGHNGGPAMDERPAKPSTPIEQSSKAVGAGKWAALAGAIWSAVTISGVLPAPYNTPEFSTVVMAIISTAAAAIGAYRANPNAGPSA